MLDAVQSFAKYEPIQMRACGGALEQEAGAVSFMPGNSGLLFRSPCGSGKAGVILFGALHHWNGNVERPTISGTIQLGDWVGHLTNGVWRKALH